VALFGVRYASGAEGVSISNARGVTGRLVNPPEVPGSFQRRSRMFGEAIQLADSGADVATEMRSLLAKEASLVKWVSLRGGLTFLSIALEDPAQSLAKMRSYAGREGPEDLDRLVAAYPLIEKASFTDVLEDPLLVRSNVWHLDFIAWCASAFAGGQLHRTLLQGEIPAAQALTAPGWYAEPVFAKCERFWDGGDWTSRCRVLEGRRWEAFVSTF
jgi:hypothetical protein